MQILGFNKLTLLDYPEHVGSTIFTGGCNFRCPFCQNGDLVLNPETVEPFSVDEVLKTLKERVGRVEGVCITGGEPTLQPDLIPFISEVKALGLKVKLDTNGYRPDVLSEILNQKLVDYVAMDIKNSKEKYGKSVGIAHFDTAPIEHSVNMLMQSSIDYEFRTTVVKELHDKNDFTAIGEWIKGAPKYFLQGYVESDNVLCKGFSAYGKDELESFRELLLKYIKHVEIRGL